MIFFYFYFILTLFAYVCSTPIGVQKDINQLKYIVLHISNAELIINQNLGARVTSLKYNGIELLTGPEVNKENYGSTLWTAPQSNWGWPPYDTLDCKPYFLSENPEKIILSSLPSKKSGFQMTKTFLANSKDSSFIIIYSIKNSSKTVKSVGPWEVTRVFPGGYCFFPAASDSNIMKESGLPGVTLKDGIIWFDYDFAKIKDDSKLFAMASEGWLAHVNHGIIFIKVFEDLPTKSIAPGQGEIEIYADGEKKYVELENHGEYKFLTPGDSVVYLVKWMLRTLPANLNNSLKRVELVKWIRRQVGK